jgi:hypothetical protein
MPSATGVLHVVRIAMLSHPLMSPFLVRPQLLKRP